MVAAVGGQAERTVQTVKRLLKESKDPHLALLVYRTTPFPWCGLSPTELLMGRRLRANIPMTSDQLTPDWTFLKQFKRSNHNFKEQQRRNYNHRHRVRVLTPIPDDTAVWVTSGNQPTTGQVISPANSPRSYMVETPSGTVRRNRHHLNIRPERPPESPNI